MFSTIDMNKFMGVKLGQSNRITDKYDFEHANTTGRVLPVHPSNPAVFELKNPNENIIGRVN